MIDLLTITRTAPCSPHPTEPTAKLWRFPTTGSSETIDGFCVSLHRGRQTQQLWLHQQGGITGEDLWFGPFHPDEDLGRTLLKADIFDKP